MTPAERTIRMRTNLVILVPGDRGYQDWADRRELLALLDECRASHAAGTMPAPAGGDRDRSVRTPADHAPEGDVGPDPSGAPDTAGPPPGQAEGEAATGAPSPPPSAAPTRCDGFHSAVGKCIREPGHPGNHRSKDGETWA